MEVESYVVMETEIDLCQSSILLTELILAYESC